MKVKLISAKLTTGHVAGIQKPDRRFKTGFRLIGEPYMTYSLSLRLSNPKGQFRVGEMVRTQYGNFRVVATNFLPLDGEMDLISVYASMKGSDFELNAEVEIMSAGFMVSEGSDYSTPRISKI